MSKIQQNTPQNTLLEQALQYEKQRSQDLQNRLQVQEQQILDLLQTIKDLSQSIKLLEAPQGKKRKFF